MSWQYVWLEIRRVLRAPQFVLLGIGIPAVMFMIFGPIYGSQQAGGLSALKYIMASMAAFGAMTASLNGGSRVAYERQTGWNRLLRLTPLRPWSYVLTRLVVALLISLPVILVVYALGATVGGIRMSLTTWLTSVVALWLGTIPFGILGLFVGFLSTAAVSGMVSSAVFLLLSMFGGLWFPVEIMPAFMATIARFTPSYWLGALARDPLSGAGISPQAVITLSAYTVVIGLFAMWAYRRDTSRT
ncbi:ABC transporter permease [Fodinicola acaciae]|uniref:ABC transporter permease n=1 Tax=Fodinicola acaciae TaxID=2681555 RepID=UPI0013D0A063|nr:ABC transporter permease [Fodinicola acaciae]